MTDTGKLKKAIANSGLKLSFIAEKLGITRYTLYNKISGETEFKASEIAALTEVLHITSDERDDIFFAPKSELESRKESDD